MNFTQLLSQDYQYEYDNATYNKEGKLDGLHSKSNYSELLYEHFYKDGVIQQAMHYSIYVEGKSPIKGIYKNGTPYEGYFVHYGDDLFTLIDYYEKGDFVCQYSRGVGDFSENIVIADIKTTFKDGKVFDGVSYRKFELGGSAVLIATEYYTQGQKTHVDLLVGAIHYAEVVKLKFLPNGYSLKYDEANKEADQSLSLNVSFKDGKHGWVSLNRDNETLCRFNFENGPITKSESIKAGMICYINKDGVYNFQKVSDMKISQDEEIHRTLLMRIMNSLLLNLIPEFSISEDNDYSKLFTREENADHLTLISFDENGEPFSGILLEEGSKAHTFNYKVFLNKKLIDSKVGLTAHELEISIQETRKAMENEMNKEWAE